MRKPVAERGAGVLTGTPAVSEPKKTASEAFDAVIADARADAAIREIRAMDARDVARELEAVGIDLDEERARLRRVRDAENAKNRGATAVPWTTRRPARRAAWALLLAACFTAALVVWGRSDNETEHGYTAKPAPDDADAGLDGGDR
jgi:hypothetical protein